MIVNMTKQQALIILNDTDIIDVSNDYYASFNTIVNIHTLTNGGRLVIDTNLDNNVVNYTYRIEHME